MELEEDFLYNTSHCPSSTELPDSLEHSFDTTPGSSPCSGSSLPVPGSDFELKTKTSKPGNAFSQFHVSQDFERPWTSDSKFRLRATRAQAHPPSIHASIANQFIINRQL